MVEVKGFPDSKEELAVLNQCQEMLDREVAADKKVKEAQQALNEKVLAKYPKLSLAETKTLVVEDKWLATVEADIRAEVDRVTQTLTGRVKALEERYAEPLPMLNVEVNAISARVNEHLKKMGLVWN
jgi:type I restriction enzyme M protein